MVEIFMLIYFRNCATSTVKGSTDICVHYKQANLRSLLANIQTKHEVNLELDELS